MPLGLSATYFPENMLHNLSERVYNASIENKYNVLFDLINDLFFVKD